MRHFRQPMHRADGPPFRIVGILAVQRPLTILQDLPLTAAFRLQALGHDQGPPNHPHRWPESV